jgi:hypothetical protein
MATIVVIACAVFVPFYLSAESKKSNDKNSSSSSSSSSIASNNLQDGSNSNSDESPSLTGVTAATDAPTPITLIPTTMAPSFSSPTESPSVTPSALASDVPSMVPTGFPSGGPTATPSSSPSISGYPVNPVPDNPPRGYFNYDPDDGQYGPRKWGSVDTSDSYMREFGNNGWGAWVGHFSDDPADNQCGSNERRQSPKDLYSTFPCDATHEIRTFVRKSSSSSSSFLTVKPSLAVDDDMPFWSVSFDFGFSFVVVAAWFVFFIKCFPFSFAFIL